MKRSKRTIVSLVLAAMLLTGLIWRFLPHSFSKVLTVDSSDLSELTCTATIAGVEDGELFMDTYAMPTVTPDEEHFSELIKILNHTDYRQDFRNLLPFPITTVSVDGSARSANVSLRWGNAPEQACHISYHGENLISVSHSGADGFLVYHPTDPAALNGLVEYLQLHGDRT